MMQKTTKKFLLKKDLLDQQVESNVVHNFKFQVGTAELHNTFIK
jgi:hypothetical protein